MGRGLKLNLFLWIFPPLSAPWGVTSLPPSYSPSLPFSLSLSLPPSPAPGLQIQIPSSFIIVLLDRGLGNIWLFVSKAKYLRSTSKSIFFFQNRACVSWRLVANHILSVLESFPGYVTRPALHCLYWPSWVWLNCKWVLCARPKGCGLCSTGFVETGEIDRVAGWALPMLF